MKYEGSKITKMDKDVSVYLFSFGVKEVEIMRSVFDHSYHSMPKHFQLSPFRNRLRNMLKELEEFKKTHKPATWINKT